MKAQNRSTKHQPTQKSRIYIPSKEPQDIISTHQPEPQHFLTRCKPLNNQICNGWKICEIQPFFQVKIWSHATETTKKTQGVWKFEGKKPGSVHLFVLPSFDRSR